MFIIDTEGLSSPIVTLRVGHGRKALLANKNVLSKASFFAKCLADGQFGLKNEMEFPEDDPEEMVAILRYLHTGEVLKWEDGWSQHDRPYPRDIPDVIRAYAIADKYCVEGMCQIVLDTIDACFPTSQVSYFHLSQMKEAGLRGSNLWTFLLGRITGGLINSDNADLQTLLRDGLESDYEIHKELLERLAVDMAEADALKKMERLTVEYKMTARSPNAW